MVEVNITLELIKQLLKAGIVWMFMFFLGILTCLGVLVVVWLIPHLKNIIKNINLMTKFRKEVPLSTIYCDVKDCKYINEDGKCEREIININTQVECESFERKGENGTRD